MLLAALVLAAGVLSPSSPIYAQGYDAPRGPGVKIVSIKDVISESEKAIYIRTQSPVVVGRPTFNYLPGEGGDTILTADFDGLSYNSPTRIIRLNSPENRLNRENSQPGSGNFKPRFAGIKEIHVGQFQQSPPKFRVSFIAGDAKALKSVSVGAAPGMLKISWADGPAPVASRGKTAGSGSEIASTSDSTTSAPKVAPNVVKPSLAPRLAGAATPPVAPPVKGSLLSGSDSQPKSSPNKANNQKAKGEKSHTEKAGSQSVVTETTANEKSVSKVSSGGWLSRLKTRTLDMIGLADEKSELEKGPPAKPENSSSMTETAFVPSTSANMPAPQAAVASREPIPEDNGPPPTITLEKVDDQGSGATLEIFRVEMPDSRELSFKSFRLHNPERYVMDIPDARAITSATLPDITRSPLVKSIRVGVPSENEGVGRLVLELEGNNVSVDELMHAGSSYMTITLAKGLGTAGGATSSQSFGAVPVTPVPEGPIIVPRAPQETVVVLDAGHGGSDPGAQRGDVNEADVTMAIINKLKKVLEGKGARIVMTRSDNTFISLEERVRITNQVNPNLFLSVHINSLQSTSDIRGIETYYQTDQSRPLAARVHESLVTGLGAPDRSVRKARFYVINHTPVPAILAEVGYITNKTERDRLISSDYQLKIANALARGVMLYLQDVNRGGQMAGNARQGVR